MFNPFISFITAFKKFKSPYDIIQHSALYSWKANNIRVVAPLNEVGLKEPCSGYHNLSLIEGVKRGRELGFSTQSPIIKDMIDKSLSLVDTPMVALINSDIIILENFTDIIKRIFDKYGYDIFIVGSRKDIKVVQRVDSPEEYKKVQVMDSKVYDVSTSSDIFITSKFIWRKIASEMPEFILGRYCWDNYLHTYAEIHSLKKYNFTDTLITLHCEHNHEHIFNQEKMKEKNALSSQHNIKLWEDIRGVYGTTNIRFWPKIEI